MKQASDILTVVGKEWLDRPNGHTYCATRSFWNGHYIARSEFEFGYDGFYLQAARESLEGKLPDFEVNHYDNGMLAPLWVIARMGSFTLEKWITTRHTRAEVQLWGSDWGTV